MYPSSSYHLSPPGSPPSSSSSSSTSSEENARQELRRQKRVATYEAVRYMVNYMANNVIPLILVNYMSNNKERTYIERNREEGHVHLFNDYFSENPVYPPQMFRRRFRMRKHLFLRIVEGVGAYDRHFQHKPDATGRLSLSPLIKCTAALRLLAYGEAADRVDEYLRLGESTARKVLVRFLEAVIHQFGDEYLRRPTVQDLQRLLQVGAYRGFPGMLGSIDCMHWKWKNCPKAWRGQFQGRSGEATVILEAVASQDLWIWHSFFGVPGSCKDINVLHRSPVFDDVLNGRAPRVNYIVNGQQFDTGYYLTDGIYPQWPTFIP
ncbi:uncharacterized protein LOC141656282 [Silene latifolia]|uniref:uncharacterized protein LOC141656282 n=1 Tax=Silene latifolia TaxID=37657 RepID=UPI003D778DBA